MRSKPKPATRRKPAAPARNERTSKRVASIAGKISHTLTGWRDDIPIELTLPNGVSVPVCTVAELQALAGSALTQARDR